MPSTAAPPTQRLFELLDQAFAQSEQIIRKVHPDQASLATPCALFDVDALIGHMVFAADRVAGAGRRDTMADNGPAVNGTGIPESEWVVSFTNAATEARDAWRRPGAFEGEIVLPFGTFPATTVAEIYALEQVTHAWDLATAVAATDRLDQELAEAVLPLAADVIRPEYRGPEPMPFAAEVAVSLTAPPADRLAGFMGRDVGSALGAVSPHDRKERVDLVRTLGKHRGFLRQTVQGLSDDLARRRTTVSELCLGGIIKHVTRVERGWVAFIEQGPAKPGVDASSYAEQAASFIMTEEDTLDALLDDYQTVADRTDALVERITSLDTARPLPQAPWFEEGEEWTARRVLLHVLAETAQHAGHADILREAIDGAKTMG